MQLKKKPPKLPKTLLIHNHINPVINTKNVNEENENLPVLCVFCSLLANNYWKLVKKIKEQNVLAKAELSSCFYCQQTIRRTR